MQLPYFIFKGVRSDSMGVVVNEYPPISRPPERITSVIVPGRSGTLTVAESNRTIFDSYSRAFECSLIPGSNIDAVFAWLSGAGDLVAGNEPNRRYKARIAAQIDMNKIIRGNPYRAFTLVVVVQPEKYLYPSALAIELTASPAQLTNPGNTPALPKITVYGSGDGVLSINTQPVQISGMTGGIILDWSADVITDPSGTVNQASMVEGGPQYIDPGHNAVLWTGGITGIKVEPNWRFV